eukprot:6475235-Amphidinium_carterae.1
MAVSKKLREAEPVLEQIAGKHVNLLVGDTGVGKTSFFLFMAGCRFSPGEPDGGESFVISGVPEALTDCKVSGRTQSVTDCIACWPIERKQDSSLAFGLKSFTSMASKLIGGSSSIERNEGLLVDTPGFNDTRGDTLDVLMAILIRRIAERCASLRFVAFFDMRALLTRRGKDARDALSNLTSWVPGMQSYLQSITFVFTSPRDALIRTCTQEALKALRQQLIRDIRALKEGTAVDKQSIWQWIEDDLTADRPQFCHIFVPHLADKQELASMLLAKGGREGSNDGPCCIRHPRDVVKCALGPAKEQALRASLDEAVEQVEVMLACSDWEATVIDEKLAALRCMTEHIGSDMPFVGRASQKAQEVVQRAIAEQAETVRQHILASTTVQASPPSGDYVTATLEMLRRLRSLCPFGDMTAADSLQHLLQLRLKEVQDEFLSRLQSDS